MSEPTLQQRALHALSINNFQLCKDAPVVGCYLCISIWRSGGENSAASFEWPGFMEEGTAACPSCGVDALIPQVAGIKVTKELLESMNQTWFDGHKPL